MADLYSPTTSVDLSRLPAPTVVEQRSYEDILAENVASFQELMPSFDATVDSDPAVKLLQLFSYRQFLLLQQFNDRARQLMIAYATGSNLDQLAINFSVTRLVLDPGDEDLGIDPVYETDDALRERVVLAPESYSVAGPDSAYVFHARSADATIRDASATSPTPGVVLVSILSSIGDGTASADQIEEVENVLAVVGGNKVRPLTDEVIIASAQIVPYTIVARLTLFSGPDEAVVLSAAQVRLNKWLETSGRLGMDAVRAAMIAALMVEGVQNVALISPAADVVVDQTQAAHCVGVAVTSDGRDD